MKIDYDKWCNHCRNYNLDVSRGILCKLTNEKPSFRNTCSNYNLDEKKIKFLEHKQHINSKREFQKDSFWNWRVTLFDVINEKKLLIPFYVVMVIFVIYNFDSSSFESIAFVVFVVVYTIMLIFSTRYISKNERYILVENNRIQDILGPGLFTKLSIHKYKRVNINSIAPDLLNSKYDHELKNRINELLKNQTLNL